MKYSTIKRLLDLCVAAVVLGFLLPALLLVALMLKLSSPGPIFFKQTRIGHRCCPFELLKFRTMSVNEARDFGKELNPTDPEITSVGRYLRRFKIDELPQLLNVLAGEMSLVGPRPPLQGLLDEMSDEDKKRFDVLPGLTGLAQVNGNIQLSWPERFRYDLEYVAGYSLLMDVRILLKTILIVIFGEEKFLSKRYKK